MQDVLFSQILRLAHRLRQAGSRLISFDGCEEQREGSRPRDPWFAGPDVDPIKAFGYINLQTG